MRTSGSLPAIGEKYAPEFEGAAVRHIAGRELNKLDKAFRLLEAGDAVCAEGKEEELAELAAYIVRRQRDYKKQDLRRSLENRLLIPIGEHCVTGFIPRREQRHLSLLCGQSAMEAGGEIIIPYKAVVQTLGELKVSWQVEALGEWLFACGPVLPPRSKETYGLFAKAIRRAAENLPNRPYVLDMGCGCGALAFITAKELQSIKPTITASDILPEAIGCSRLNQERLMEAGLLENSQVSVSSAGPLFSKLGGAKYDLIIFNAPWVVAPARSRLEIALNDEKQVVLRAFFAEAPRHINPNGYIILGYSDNSGEMALVNALEIAKSSDFAVKQEYSARVATHRKNKKWERIFVWILKHTSER